MVPTNGSAIHHALGFDADVPAVAQLDAGRIEPGPEFVAQYERRLLIAGSDGYDDFQTAVRSAIDTRFREQHADLLSINDRQRQALVEHDALKTAFDAMVKQRDDAVLLNSTMADRCEALLKLYPAEALKRDDAGGQALRGLRDFVAQLRAVKTPKK